MRELPRVLNLYLCYNNYQVQGVLAEARINNVDVQIGEFECISMTIPEYIDSATDPTKREKNSGFELIKEEKIVYIKNCGYYVVKEISISEEANGEKNLEVKCYGQEYRLSKKNIIMETTTIQLKANAVDTYDGIFDRLEKETGWKLKMIDEEAQYDFINGGKSLKYRYFDGIQKTWWGFLTEEVQSGFDVVLFFDNLTREIYCYGRASFGKLTRLYLSKSNYLDSLQSSSNSQEIVTRLYATGKEGMTFNSVNPLGTQYVEDYTYFRNTDYMTQELITSLDVYYPRLEQLHSQWSEATSKLLGLQAERNSMENALQVLEEQMRVLKALQTNYAKEGDDSNLTRIKTEIATKQSEIDNQKKVIESKQSEIDNQQKVVQKICVDSQKENIKDTSNKAIFTKDLLDELDNFTYENSWANESCITEEGLYASAIQQLSVVCKPQVEISVNLKDLHYNDFRQRLRTDGGYDSQNGVVNYFIEECGLGHFVMIEGVSYREKIRIIGYSYSPTDEGEVGNITLTLSTSEFTLTSNGTLGSVINNSSKVSRVFNENKMSLDKARENANWIEEYYQNALDVKMKNVLASQGRNKVLINENGIWLEDGNFPDDVVLMTSGGILISDDGLTTCRTAIDAQGLVAEEIIGRLIIGQKLYISDEKGEMELLGNLLTIKDESLKTRVKLGEYDKLRKKYGLQLFDKNGNETVLDEDGIVQRERIMETDNLDKDYPMKMFVPLDDAIREVRVADLYIFPQKFRGYTRGAEVYIGTINSSGSSSNTSSGASSTTTTASGGGGTSYSGQPADWGIKGQTNYDKTVSDPYNPGKHVHEFVVSLQYGGEHIFKHSHGMPSHSHNMAHTHNIAHTHTVDIPAHEHKLIHGIYEYNQNPTLQLFVNGVQVGGDIRTDSKINIQPNLKLRENNYIEIRATGLARCTANLVLKTMASY